MNLQSFSFCFIVLWLTIEMQTLTDPLETNEQNSVQVLQVQVVKNKFLFNCAGLTLNHGMSNCKFL